MQKNPKFAILAAMKYFFNYFSACAAMWIAVFSTIFAAINFLAPTHAAAPPLTIHAVNPGYTADGHANSGEFIELRSSAGTEISLAGLTIRYTNTSGNSVTLTQFPEGSTMSGEFLLLRLASSPEAKLADTTYTKQLALAAGPLELVYGDEVISSLCWTGKDGCLAKFTSSNPTSLVWTGSTYEHQSDYEPHYDPDYPSLQVAVATTETPTPQCRGLEFSELLSYYESDKSEQFVEFHNATADTVNLTGCTLKYKTKSLTLSGTVQPDAYFAFYPSSQGLTLTKNPTSSNTLKLLDTDGAEIDTLEYKSGQKKAVAFAQFDHSAGGEEQWLQTYHPTPGEANDFQEFRSCAEGKVLNEATGNCVKSTSVETKPCPEGKYRNPLTGRCKSYSTDAAKKPCAEGYERNPDTGRCRKVRNNSAADYSLEPTATDGRTTFIALGAIALVIALGLTYVVIQFRGEIAGFVKKLFRRDKTKNSGI